MFKKWSKSKKVLVNLFQNSFMRAAPGFFNFIKLFFLRHWLSGKSVFATQQSAF